jgi:hypothetical protein
MSDGTKAFLVIVFIISVFGVGEGIDYLVGHKGWGDLFAGIVGMVSVAVAGFVYTRKGKS